MAATAASKPGWTPAPTAAQIAEPSPAASGTRARCTGRSKTSATIRRTRPDREPPPESSSNGDEAPSAASICSTWSRIVIAMPSSNER